MAKPEKKFSGIASDSSDTLITSSNCLLRAWRREGSNNNNDFSLRTAASNSTKERLFALRSLSATGYFQNFKEIANELKVTFDFVFSYILLANNKVM